MHAYLKRTTLGVCVLLLAVYAFFFNEARKEIYYLCGNFTPGVAYSSVVRQLDTITMSEYSIILDKQGKRIVHSSKLNMRLFACDIRFNRNDVVTTTHYR